MFDIGFRSLLFCRLVQTWRQSHSRNVRTFALRARVIGASCAEFRISSFQFNFVSVNCLVQRSCLTTHFSLLFISPFLFSSRAGHAPVFCSWPCVCVINSSFRLSNCSRSCVFVHCFPQHPRHPSAKSCPSKFNLKSFVRSRQEYCFCLLCCLLLPFAHRTCVVTSENIQCK